MRRGPSESQVRAQGLFPSSDCHIHAVPSSGSWVPAPLEARSRSLTQWAAPHPSCPSARPLACPDLHPQNEPRPWPARMGVSGAPLPLPSLLPGSSPLPAWCGCCKSSGGASRFPLRARCAPACCSRDLGCWLPLQVSSRPAAGSRRAVCARPSAAAQATRAGGLQRQIRSCAQARISVNGAKSRHCRAAFPSEAPGVGPCLLQLLVGGWWLSDQLPPWSRGFAPSLRQISFLL